MGKILYFCDESSFHDEHMGVAGIALDRYAVPRIITDLTKLNEVYGVKSEVKWERAKPRRMNIHKAYIDYLFALIDSNLTHFHIRFAPFKEYDHSLSGERKRAGTVGKMHYELLLHRPVWYYGQHHKLSVYPDNGDCTELLPRMKGSLNRKAKARFTFKQDCIDSIECRDSKSEPMLQLLDVTLGALTAYRNGRHEDPKTSETKRELAIYAFQRTGFESLSDSTPRHHSKLNVWNVKPLWDTKRGPRR